MKPNIGNLYEDWDYTGVNPEDRGAFMRFYMQFHKEFYERTRIINSVRGDRAYSRHRHEEYSKISWKIELPHWCNDQRNQMTGPADSAELTVKMLNSGSPGVMLDLEDSMANTWDSLQVGYTNITKALEGTLTYEKRGETKGITGNPVVWSRVRGLHLMQVVNGLTTSASLFDVANLIYRHRVDKVKHPLCLYIPKTESADEAKWWSRVLKFAARQIGLPGNYIKCMALVESYPMACNLPGFIYHLKDHLLGLNLGRWDYMASWIDNVMDTESYVLPDRNSIPHDAKFFQNLRKHLVDVCHEFGILAIGGMTALYPSRSDKELNDRALKLLEEDKKNEASCGFDGAWTGHPDQNEIAVAAFPEPNQLNAHSYDFDFVLSDLLEFDDLRNIEATLDGTRTCVRVAIRYRNGVLNGKGAVLLDGYMEDLATDRICRLMIAQRLKWETHGHIYEAEPLVSLMFEEELQRLIDEKTDIGTEATLRQAAKETKDLIYSKQHNPV